MRFPRRALSLSVWILAASAVLPGRAEAQGQLVPIVTNNTPLPLSNRVALSSASATNQAGDFAYFDAGQSLFLRRAGQPMIRVMQAGDEVPGLPGSRVLSVGGIRMNDAGLLAIHVDFNVASGEAQGALLTYSGSTLTTVLTGLDTAPNSGGARFERTISLQALNGAGAILFSAPLALSGSGAPVQSTLFVLPLGGAPVRLAGQGDAAPGTAATIVAPLPSHFNNNGEVLFFTLLTGGAGGTGFFVASAGVAVRKVVATGDPNPLGGTFGMLGNTGAMNGDGEVAFSGGNALWIHRPATGLEMILTILSAAPVPGGGTFSGFTVHTMNDAEAIVVNATIAGNGNVPFALFRFVGPGNAQLVAHRSQTAPGMPGQLFGNFGTASINGSGTVAFCVQAIANLFLGCYTQSGIDIAVPVALHTQSTTLAGGGTYDFTPTGLGLQRPTLYDNGNVAIRAAVASGDDDFTEIMKLAGGGTTTLFKSTDTIPAGGTPLLARRTFGTSGSGNFVSFLAQRPGGVFSAVVHNLATNTSTVVATEGQDIAGLVERPRFDGVTTVFVNSSGQVPLSALLYGGPFFRGGVLLASPSGVVPVVVDGQTDTAGRTLSFTFTTASGASPINDAGQVLFAARVNGASATNGIYVGTAGGTPVKAALVGDAVTSGHTITSIPNSAATRGINSAGQVIFQAVTTAGNTGLYIVTPGGVPVSLARPGEAAPGGGTFNVIGMAGFNNSGQVVFQATTTGGAGGGVYLASAGQPTVALALNGAAAPSGGNFLLTIVRPEVAINDAGDVVFLSDLTGGTATSGYFVRRGPAGVLQTLVLQGAPAPGTLGTFFSLNHGLNFTVNEFMQLSPTGQLSFFGTVAQFGGIIAGNWHVGTGGIVEPLAVWGTTQPAEFGGGTIVRSGPFSAWAGGNRFPVFAALTGGTFRDGVMMYFAPIDTAVGTGTNVVVSPVDAVTLNSPVTLTFSNVTVAGIARLSIDAGAPLLPAAYRHGNPPRFYNLTTTASFTGPITVCVNFSGTTFPPGSVVRMLHHNGAAWSDITTTGPTGNSICGSANALSPFTVVRVFNAFGPQMIQNGGFDNGLANWGTFATPDLSYINASVVGGVLEYFRVPPPPGTANQAVVLQQTGVPLQAFTPLVATFSVGNSSTVRKRMSVLIHDQDFSDLHVCTFWMPPSMPLSPFVIRTHTTKAWTGATVSFYAASAGSNGGAYRLDNVSLRANADVSADQTDCVDPNAPAPTGGGPGPTLLTNGDFSAGLPPWTTFGQISSQIAGGVFEFVKLPGAPAGVVLQASAQTTSANEILTATFDLGNSSAVRKRVTVLLHDLSFGDLAACTFWLAPGQPLTTYTMRMFSTQPWANATLSVYPATTGLDQWIRLDNVALQRTPGTPTFGTDCIRPPVTAPSPNPGGGG